MSAKPRTPQSVVERIFKDSRTRKRLFAATSVLSLLTVVVTVGVLTFPAISISGSHEALQEQGVNISESENTVELFAEAAAETAQLVANRGEAVATSDAFAAGADAPADGVATPIEGTTIVAPEVATDVASAPDAAATEQGGAASASATSDADQAADAAVEPDQDTSSETEQDAPTPVAPSASAERALQEADLASKRLIVGAETREAAAALAADEHAVAAFDGVYLLQYKNEEEAAQGFLGYYDSASFVTPDVAVQIADDAAKENIDPQEEIISTNNIFTEEENPFVELEAALDEAPTQQAEEAAKAHDVLLVALVDTGVASANSKDATEAQAAAAIAANVVDSVSMVGKSPRDDNGHGQRMAEYIVEENPAAQILSIKALGKNGTGDVSAVIAGINYAIERGANIINLSLCAYASDENAALADAIRRAEEAGVVVVGAAGNQGYNARYYIPGNIEEAFVVGSADEVGKRIEASNFGETVDYNVVSAATSEAAARMSGILSADVLQESVDAAKVFPADFDPEELTDGTQDTEGADVEDADGEDAEATTAPDGEEADTEDADAQDGETNAPEVFEGAQVQDTTVTQAAATGDARQYLIDMKSESNDGFTNITVSSWDALEWAIGHCSSSALVTIIVDKDLAAYKTLTIPAGKNIKIVASHNATIYRDNNPADGMGSFFSVDGELNLNGIELSGQAIGVSVEIIPGQEATTRYDYDGFAVSKAGAYPDGTAMAVTIGSDEYFLYRKSDNSFGPAANRLYSQIFEFTDLTGRNKYGTNIDRNSFLSGQYYMYSPNASNLFTGVYLSGAHVGNIYPVEDFTNNQDQWAPNLIWEAKSFWNGATKYTVWYNAANDVYLKRSGDTVTVAPASIVTGWVDKGTSYNYIFGNPSSNGKEVNDSSFITVNNAGKVTLDNATLTKSNSSDTDKAPVIVDNGGTLNINSGTSIENNSGITAGAIINDGGTVNINDGAIKNNSATVAGAIFNSGGTVNLNGGTIEKNTAKIAVDADLASYAGLSHYDRYGEKYEDRDTTQKIEDAYTRTAGAIFMKSGAVNIADGTIDTNKGDAGAIWMEDGTLTMTGGQIKRNNGIHAGAIYMNGGTFNMHSGTIGGKYNDSSAATDGNTSIYRSGAVTVQKGASMLMDIYTYVADDTKIKTLVKDKDGNAINSAPEINYNRTMDKGGAIYAASDNVNLIRGRLAGNAATWMGGAVYVQGDKPTDLTILRLGTDLNGNPVKAYIYDNTAKVLGGVSYSYGGESKTLSSISYSGGDYWPQAGLGGGIWYCMWSTVLHDDNRILIDRNYLDNGTDVNTTDSNGQRGVDVHMSAGDHNGLIAEWKTTNGTWIDGNGEQFNEGSVPAHDGVALQHDTSEEIKTDPLGNLVIHDNAAELGGGMGLNGIITFRDLPVYRKFAVAQLDLTKNWKDEAGRDLATVDDRLVALTVTFKGTSGETKHIERTQTFYLAKDRTFAPSEAAGSGVASEGWTAHVGLPTDVVEITARIAENEPDWGSKTSVYEKLLAYKDKEGTNLSFNAETGTYTLGDDFEITIKETVYTKTPGTSWPADLDSPDESKRTAAAASLPVLDSDTYTLSASDLSISQDGEDVIRHDEYGQVIIDVMARFTLGTTLSNTVESGKYSLNLTKVDAEDASTTLEGAKFKLYQFDKKQDDVVTYALFDENNKFIEWSPVGTEVATDAQGNLTFKGLKPGVYYIVESAAPSGYVASAQPIQVVISETGQWCTNPVYGEVSLSGGVINVAGTQITPSDGGSQYDKLYLQNFDGTTATALTPATTASDDTRSPQYLISTMDHRDDGNSWYLWDAEDGSLGFRGSKQDSWVNATYNDPEGARMRWEVELINGTPVLRNSHTGNYLAVKDGQVQVLDIGELSESTQDAKILVENTKAPTIVLQKKDLETNKLLPGATFTIAKKGSENSVPLKDNEDGTFEIAFFELEDYGPSTIYVISETEAPEDYVGIGSDIELTISPAGVVTWLKQPAGVSKEKAAGASGTGNSGSSEESNSGDSQANSASTSVEDPYFKPRDLGTEDWGANTDVVITPIKDNQGTVIENAQVTLMRIPKGHPNEQWENYKWYSTADNKKLKLIAGEDYIITAKKDGYIIPDVRFSVPARGAVVTPNNGDGYIPRKHSVSTTTNPITVTYNHGTSENGWYSRKSVTFADGSTENVFCGASAKDAGDTFYSTRTIWNADLSAWQDPNGANWQDGLLTNASRDTYWRWLDRVAYLYTYEYKQQDSGANHTLDSGKNVLTGWDLRDAVQKVLYNGYPYNAAGFTDTASLRKTTQEALFYVLKNGAAYKKGAAKLSDGNYRSYSNTAMFDALVNYALNGDTVSTIAGQDSNKPLIFQNYPEGTETYVYWYTQGNPAGVPNLTSQPLIGIYAPSEAQTITATAIGYKLDAPAENDDTPDAPDTIIVINEKPQTPTITLKKINENGSALSGATFEIREQGGEKFEKLESEDGTFTINFKDLNLDNPYSPDTIYIVQEIDSPKGYDILSSPLIFKVSATGEITWVSKPGGVYDTYTATKTIVVGGGSSGEDESTGSESSTPTVENVEDSDFQPSNHENEDWGQNAKVIFTPIRDADTNAVIQGAQVTLKRHPSSKPNESWTNAKWINTNSNYELTLIAGESYTLSAKKNGYTIQDYTFTAAGNTKVVPGNGTWSFDGKTEVNYLVSSSSATSHKQVQDKQNASLTYDVFCLNRYDSMDSGANFATRAVYGENATDGGGTNIVFASILRNGKGNDNYYDVMFTQDAQKGILFKYLRKALYYGYLGQAADLGVTGEDLYTVTQDVIWQITHYGYAGQKSRYNLPMGGYDFVHGNEAAFNKLLDIVIWEYDQYPDPDGDLYIYWGPNGPTGKAQNLIGASFGSTQEFTTLGEKVSTPDSTDPGNNPGSEEETVVVSGTSTITVPNTKKTFLVEVLKIDKDKKDKDGNPLTLPGATFALTTDDSENKPLEKTTMEDTQGRAAFGGLKANTTYRITETKAPAGYKKYDGVIEFVIADDGKITRTGANTTDNISIADGIPITITVPNEQNVQIEKYVNKKVHSDIQVQDSFEYSIMAFAPAGAKELVIEDVLEQDLEFMDLAGKFGDEITYSKVVRNDIDQSFIGIGWVKENNHIGDGETGTVVGKDSPITPIEDLGNAENIDVVDRGQGTKSYESEYAGSEIMFSKDVEGDAARDKITVRIVRDHPEDRWYRISFKVHIKEDRRKAIMEAINDEKFDAINTWETIKTDGSVLKGKDVNDTDGSHEGISNVASYTVKFDGYSLSKDSNVVTVKPKSETSATLEAKKKFYSNNTLTEVPEDTFTFELSAVTSGAPMPSSAKDGIATVMNAASDASKIAAVVFDEVTFTEPGTYKYKITEVSGTNEKMNYDGSTYYAIVTTAYDDDGKLAATVEYEKEIDQGSNEQTAGLPIFANHGVLAWSITLHKTDSLGSALSGAQFSLYTENDYSTKSNPRTVHGSDISDFTWGDLAQGTYYIVEDSAPEGYEKLDKPIIVTITETGGAGDKTATIKLNDGSPANVQLVANKTTTNDTAKALELTAANEPKTYGFTLIKGNDWNENFKEAIKKGSLANAITANQSESAGMTLDGAEFTLKDVTPRDHKFYTYHKAGDRTTVDMFFMGNGVWAETPSGAHLVSAVDSDGVVGNISGLYPGKYILTEVKAPAGYETVDETPTASKYWTIEIDANGKISFERSNTSTSADTDKSLIEIYSEDNTHIVGITNVPKTYTLPSTGGPGVVPFALLAVLAFAFVLARLKRPLRAWQE